MQSTYKLICESFIPGVYLINYTNHKGKSKVLTRTKIGNNLKFSLFGKNITFKKIGEVIKNV